VLQYVYIKCSNY